MEIKYFLQHISLSGEFKDLIEEKIKKFERINSHILEAKVDLSYSPQHGKRYGRKETLRLEINLSLPNKVLQADYRAGDIQTAIDKVESKLFKQLRRYKTFGESKKKKTSKIIRKLKSAQG